MKRIVFVAAMLMAAPAAAQDGPSLIERGIEMVLRNMLSDVQPGLEEVARGLDRTAQRYGPALENIAALMDDIANYELPERLENGDIILRRKAGAPPPPPITDALRDLAPSPTPEGGSTSIPLPTGPKTDL